MLIDAALAMTTYDVKRVVMCCEAMSKKEAHLLVGATAQLRTLGASFSGWLVRRQRKRIRACLFGFFKGLSQWRGSGPEREALARCQ